MTKEIITNYAVYFIEVLIAYFYFSKIFEAKVSGVKIILIGSFFYFIAGSLNLLFDNNLLLNMFSFIATTALFAVLSYHIYLRSALFHAVVLTAFVLASEFLAVYLISSIINGSLELYKTNYTIYIIDALFCKTLYFMICVLATKFAQRGKKEESAGLANLLMLYPACVLAVLLLFRKLDAGAVPRFNTEIIAINFILLGSVVLVFIIYEASIKKERALSQLQSEIQRKEINETYLGILEHQNNELQILVHDTKNHLAVIENLSDSKEVEKYIQTIYQDIKKYSVTGNTNNKILDLILNKYQALCEMSGIDFEISVKTANLEHLNDSDLSALLNNLLDNAVESAKKSEKKFISLTIKHIGEMDMLNVINSCDAAPKVKNRDLLTTKKDKAVHGYGTKSIKRIMEKYSGEFEWRFDLADNTFHATVLFGDR